MNQAPTNVAQPRHGLVDALRGIALLGILIVNLEFIASAPFLGWDGSDAWWDVGARWVDITFFQLKSYLVFALLFGYGLAIMTSRDPDGKLGRRYSRRMALLFALGALHALFFFIGDILLSYAIIGALLFPVRNWPTNKLLRLAGWLFAAGTAIVLLVAFAIATQGGVDVDPTQAARTATYADGGFWDVVGQRLEDLPVALLVIVVLNWASVASAFCVGLVLGRSDLLANPSRHVERARRVMRWALPLGFGACGLAGVLTLTSDERTGGVAPAIGLLLQHLAAPVAVAGFIAAAIVLAGTRRWWGRVQHWVTPGGSSSLSMYLGESVVASVLFCGYGLGWVNQVGPALSLFIALGVWGGLEVAARLWRRRYRQGPAEWILRSVTYWRIQPLRNRESSLSPRPEPAPRHRSDSKS